jgi:predicted regulator of Ras-like GTPase activity (Roadblock/LC7/MglB family)
MFAERLQHVKDQVEGTVAVSLVAKDGIPVESVGKEDESLDLEMLSAELMSQIRTVAQNHQELAVGQVRQFSVTTDRFTMIVGALTEDYYLLLVLSSTANVGRARFELRRSVLLFEEDLI